MAEYLVKIANEQGHLQQQVERGYSESEIRDRFVPLVETDLSKTAKLVGERVVGLEFDCLVKIWQCCIELILHYRGHPALAIGHFILWSDFDCL